MGACNLVGPQIRKLRYEKGWTQAYLAGQLQIIGLDISRSTLAKIEARLIVVPDYRLLYFTKVFNVRIEQLFPPIHPQDPMMIDTLTKYMNHKF